MTERIIAIGDIHGCNVALKALIDAIAPTPQDVVITLGDYVDRGPDSRGCVDTLIELSKITRFVGILGNHEEMMLEVIQGRASHHDWVRYGANDTLDSYGFDGNLDFLPPSHEAFYAGLGDYFVYDDYFFTHACYDAEQPLEHQPVDLLRWHSLTGGLPNRHYSGKTAVVGHTAQRGGEIFDVGHLICLDTYCYGGGWLTAMDLHSKKTWQVNQAGEIRH